MVTSASPLDLAITPRVVSDCETREFAVRLEGVASVSLQEGFCVLYGFPYRRQPRVRRTAGSLEDVASDETLQSLFFFSPLVSLLSKRTPRRNAPLPFVHCVETLFGIP